jgi:hypothetical protein
MYSSMFAGTLLRCLLARLSSSVSEDARVYVSYGISSSIVVKHLVGLGLRYFFISSLFN